MSDSGLYPPGLYVDEPEPWECELYQSWEDERDRGISVRGARAGLIAAGVLSKPVLDLFEQMLVYAFHGGRHSVADGFVICRLCENSMKRPLTQAKPEPPEVEPAPKPPPPPPNETTTKGPPPPVPSTADHA